VFLVLPEAWPAVTLFLASQTQWRTAGMAGIRTGLDYAGVAVVARAQGKNFRGELFSDLQSVESGALDELLIQAERRAREAKADG